MTHAQQANAAPPCAFCGLTASLAVYSGGKGLEHQMTFVFPLCASCDAIVSVMAEGLGPNIEAWRCILIDDLPLAVVEAIGFRAIEVNLRSRLAERAKAVAAAMDILCDSSPG